MIYAPFSDRTRQVYASESLLYDMYIMLMHSPRQYVFSREY